MDYGHATDGAILFGADSCAAAACWIFVMLTKALR
jgi:hypothetical protein